MPLQGAQPLGAAAAGGRLCGGPLPLEELLLMLLLQLLLLLQGVCWARLPPERWPQLGPLPPLLGQRRPLFRRVAVERGRVLVLKPRPRLLLLEEQQLLLLHAGLLMAQLRSLRALCHLHEFARLQLCPFLHHRLRFPPPFRDSGGRRARGW